MGLKVYKFIIPVILQGYSALVFYLGIAYKICYSILCRTILCRGKEKIQVSFARVNSVNTREKEDAGASRSSENELLFHY